MTEKMAQQVAADFAHDNKRAVTKIGSSVTNGVKRFFVHVTWQEDEEGRRRRPFTIASPTQA